MPEHMMAQWLLAADGLGGMVHPSRPGVIGGQTFSLPNPPVGGAQLPTGTVAMMVSHDQVDQAAWLRVGDTRDPQFQADASVQGDISAGGTVSAGQYLELGAVEEWRWPCDTPGTVARNSNLACCVRAVWQLAVRQGGGTPSTRAGCYSPEGIVEEPGHRQLSCPFGFTSVPISEGGDVTRGMTWLLVCSISGLMAHHVLCDYGVLGRSMRTHSGAVNVCMLFKWAPVRVPIGESHHVRRPSCP